MAFDTYLKINGVAGEAMHKSHAGEMEILSFSLGASNPATVGTGTGGLSAGRVSVSTMDIMKKSDKASPILFQACCNGKHFDQAVITLNKATGEGGQSPFLKYTLTDVMVERVQWMGNGTTGDDTPAESVSLAFAKIEVEYQQQDAKGAVGSPVLASYHLQEAVTA